jgi:hypothetical protein
MKALKALAAFIGVHVILVWIFWAGGFDFSERGQPLFWFAYLGTGLGGLVAALVYSQD